MPRWVKKHSYKLGAVTASLSKREFYWHENGGDAYYYSFDVQTSHVSSLIRIKYSGGEDEEVNDDRLVCGPICEGDIRDYYGSSSDDPPNQYEWAWSRLDIELEGECVSREYHARPLSLNDFELMAVAIIWDELGLKFIPKYNEQSSIPANVDVDHFLNSDIPRSWADEIEIRVRKEIVEGEIKAKTHYIEQPPSVQEHPQKPYVSKQMLQREAFEREWRYKRRVADWTDFRSFMFKGLWFGIGYLVLLYGLEYHSDNFAPDPSPNDQIYGVAWVLGCLITVLPAFFFLTAALFELCVNVKKVITQ